MALCTVTAVSPTGGPAVGGTLVTITGTNFTAANLGTVSFGKNKLEGPGYATKALLEEAAKGEVGGKTGYEPTYGYWIESSTVIKAYAPQSAGQGATNVTVTNRNGEVSAIAEANSWNYWSEQTSPQGPQPGTKYTETLALGSPASTQHAASFYEAAGVETLYLSLGGYYQEGAYFELSYNIEEVNGTPKVEFILEEYNGQEWKALPTSVHTGVITGVAKATGSVAEETHKPVEGKLRLAAKFTGAGGVAGTVSVASYSAVSTQQ